MSQTLRAGSDAIQQLRELLSGIDPEAKLLVDAGSGEVLVRGQLSAEQLTRAMHQAGVAAVPVLLGQGGCCGGCGCG